MAGLLRITLYILLALLVGVGAFAAWLLADPNRFKPELENLIATTSGVAVQINGDLGWQLSPPITLTAADLTAEVDGDQFDLGSLELNVNLGSVIRSRDVNDWEVRSLVLKDLVAAQAGDTTRLASLTLTDFKPNKPSPFAAVLTYQAGDAEPLPLDAKGLITVDPTQRALALTKTRLETTDASGVCDLNARARSLEVPADPEDAIIPVAVWKTINWTGDCTLDRLTLDERDFENVLVTLTNTGGDSVTDVRFNEFFGGSAGARVAINATAEPVRWTITPDLERADSQALMAWLDQRLKWIAPLAYSGEITMTGNTREELVRSVKGKTTFDGGKGKIDIGQIKKPLLGLATLFQEPDRIAAWPDLWNYERLIGEWQIDGTRHVLDFALDNLTAAINGTYDPLTDDMNMQVQFQFEDNPGMHSFDVNPVLVGLPIPLTCRGTLEAPKCGVNPEATRALVAQVLTTEQGAEARAKIDEAIEEKVPEEYQEAARGLLDILGRSLKKKD